MKGIRLLDAKPHTSSFAPVAVAAGLALSLPTSALAERISVGAIQGDESASLTRQLSRSLCSSYECVPRSEVTKKGKVDFDRMRQQKVSGFLFGSVTGRGNTSSLWLALVTDSPEPRQTWKFPLAGKGTLASASLEKLNGDLEGLLASSDRAVAATLAPPPPPSPPSTVSMQCTPPCRAGFMCVSGSCVSTCNPPCPTGERCTLDGQCVTMAPPKVVTAAVQPLPTAVPPPQARPSASPPNQDPGVGLTLAARFSLAIPFGDAYTDANTGQGVSLGQDISVAIPLQIDAGIRLAGKSFIGGYFQYGWGILKSGACPVNVSCSETGIRAGAEFLYSFLGPDSTPWVGIGTGWEWTTTSVSALGAAGSVTLDGWEFFNLQFGYDFTFPSVAKLGPFVALGVGQYYNASVSGAAPGQSVAVSGSIAQQTIHGWFQAGLKGTFDL